MKPLAILIPGFNSLEGIYMQKIEPYLVEAGFETKLFIYKKPTPFTLLNVIANRFRTKRILGELVNLIYENLERDIVLIGHSNGVMLSWAATKICQFVKCVVAFNGALNRNTLFIPPVVNCYCETDMTLKIGGRFRPLSKWGDYGAREQKQVGAIDLDLSEYGVKGHSDFLEHLDEIMPDVIYRIKEKL